MVKKEKTLIDETFFDKTGKKVKVTDYISEESCWFARRENQWVLTHSAIEHLAAVAGISMSYDVEESTSIIPSYANELAYIVRVTIHCRAKGPKDTPDECVHGERNLTITGEANRINTPSRGRGYLRKMAEKRAYDIAVLKHIGLYTTVFSEEESEQFTRKESKEPILLPGTKLFLMITEDINEILNAKDLKTLDKVAKQIKKNIKAKVYVSDKQIEYLRELHRIEHAKKVEI